MKATYRSLALYSLVAVSAALALGACADGEPDTAADTGQVTTVHDSGGSMSGMGAMSGTQDMQGLNGGGMMDQMQAHLRTMDGIRSDSLKVMLPAHRQMVANMMSQANKDMRDMNMMSDAAWTATVDSLRQDLTRMPEMSASDLQLFMPTHQARVRRLMESHRTMMGNMKM